MNEFQAFRIFLIEIDTCYTAIVYLSPELSEVCSALVINPCSREKATFVSCFEDTYRKIYIFSKTHLRKTSQLIVHLTTYSHVERTRIELIHFFLPPLIPPVVKKEVME